MATLAEIIAHAKSYGFVYPSSAIYDGLQAVYDYGPHGAALKRNLQAFWWRSMTQLHEDIVGIDAAILMDAQVWHASGHVAGFHDWMVDNRDSKKRYRVDVLVEEKAVKLGKEGKEDEADALLATMADHLENGDGAKLTKLLQDAHIDCPIAKNSNWTVARQFNLMFATHVGATQDDSSKVYLRPETAQGIFVNFLHVQQGARKKVPFGIAQIGKAFRNEIVARQFIFRMREFEQMEMQFFVPPEQEEEWFNVWKQRRKAWYHALDIPITSIRVHPHIQLAHYAHAAVDLEYDFPFGWKEVEGIHARGNFDLKTHQTHAKKKLQYFDAVQNRSYLPHIVETSVGCDRLMLMLLAEGLKVEAGANGKPRTYLRLPAALAPYQAALLPLTQKDGLPERARGIMDRMKYEFRLNYAQSGNIGKRYAQQDLIGTPYCITVDHETLEDEKVTLRNRDTTLQQRMAIDSLADFLRKEAILPALLRRVSTSLS